jgi:hypothetical protein
MFSSADSPLQHFTLDRGCRERAPGPKSGRLSAAVWMVADRDFDPPTARCPYGLDAPPSLDDQPCGHAGGSAWVVLPWAAADEPVVPLPFWWVQPGGGSSGRITSTWLAGGRGDVDRDAEVVQVQGGLDGHRAGGQLVRNLHGHRVAGCRGAADLLLTDDADLAGDGLQVPQCLGRVARAVIGQRAEAWPEPAPPASSLGSSSLVHGLWCSSGIGGPPGPYGRRSGRRPPWLPVLAATSSPAKIVRWVIASLALSASVTLSAAPWARASASCGVAVRSSTAALAQPASTRAASATPIETTWVLVRAASGTPSLRSGADGAQEHNRLSLPLPKQRKETLVAPVEAGRDPGRPDVARRWRSWGGADSLVVDRARWGASGALYPQSAPAGLNPCPRVRVRRSAPGTEC